MIDDILGVVTVVKGVHRDLARIGIAIHCTLGPASGSYVLHEESPLRSPEIYDYEARQAGSDRQACLELGEFQDQRML